MSRIAVPIKITNTPGPVGCVGVRQWYAEIEGTDIIVSDYTEAKARKKIKKLIFDAIREKEAAERNHQRHVIGTAHGEIFIIEFRNGAWGYAITGPDRKGGSYTHGHDTYDHAVGGALKHVNDAFEGVAWRHSF